MARQRNKNRLGAGRFMWAFECSTRIVRCIAGCEVDSFMDPSKVGAYQRTPIVLPILSELALIDEPREEPPGIVKDSCRGFDS